MYYDQYAAAGDSVVIVGIDGRRSCRLRPAQQHLMLSDHAHWAIIKKILLGLETSLRKGCEPLVCDSVEKVLENYILTGIVYVRYPWHKA